QVIALSAYVRRLYAPRRPATHRSELVEGRWIDRSRYDGKLVLGAICSQEELSHALRTLGGAVTPGETLALELVVLTRGKTDGAALAARARESFGENLPAERVTLSLTGDAGFSHFTFGPNGLLDLHGLHPETAARVDLSRYQNFELERMWS